MREHGISRLAQYVIAKFVREREQNDEDRRGVSLLELNARVAEADAKAQADADRVLQALRGK
jgi:hypothetical protein